MRENKLRCHYCDFEQKPPETCPKCGSPHIRYFGTGTQKVEEEFAKFFPKVPVLRMDMDTTRGKDGHRDILRAFRAGEARVLIGTQMIAKGHDFPNVTLVGIVAADLSLNVPDYRSEERTFELLTQMEGRAGRGGLPGRVVVQSYDPEHYAIQLAASQDYRAFYHTEMNRRRKGLFPPYTVLARLLVTGRQREDVRHAAEALGERFCQLLDEKSLRRLVVQTRAMEAPLALIRDEYRWQVFCKLYAKGGEPVLDALRELSRGEAAEGVRVALEIDPANML
jgi:primosomal protein N' (replication factor Y)